MNKKGIMLKFLVTVILALLIFTPTCMFASKFFRLSQQARENFVQFVTEVDDFSRDTSHPTKTFLLIMDDDTTIIGFNTKRPLQSCLQANGKEQCESWLVPATEDCSGEGACVCLIRQADVDGLAKYQPTVVSCSLLEGVQFSMPVHNSKVYLENTYQGDVEFILKDGFILYRTSDSTLLSTFTYRYAPFRDASRRTPITLMKDGATIKVCRSEFCEPTKGVLDDFGPILADRYGFTSSSFFTVNP